MLGKDVLVQERWFRVDHEGLQANYASLGTGVLFGLGAGRPSLCCACVAGMVALRVAKKQNNDGFRKKNRTPVERRNRIVSLTVGVQRAPLEIL